MAAAAALAATTMGVGSCGSTSGGGGSTITVTGTKLTIYAAAPANAPDAADILDAEKLAFKGTTRINKYSVRFVPLTGSKLSDDARTAIEDTTSIAYLGEIGPGTSADSVGITNGADLLQVTPTDTGLELTQATPAIPSAPGVYYEARGTYGQTFARVVPTTFQEARAQVQEMQKLKVSKLYVTADGSQYGAAIALSVKKAATSAGISATEGPATPAGFQSSGADAIFDGASAEGANTARALLSAVAQQNANAKMFVASALSNQSFVSGLGSASAHLYASSPGFLAKDLAPAGKQFVSEFTSTYGHAPAITAIFGYEAMKATLAVLQEAGASANDRSRVVKDFLSIRNRSSVLGTYSINSTGDTSLSAFVFSRVKAGQLTPFASIPSQG